MRTVEEHVPAPKDFGVALIGVQEGSEMELDLRFEAVHEGILVSGTVDVEVKGECGRCLDPLRYGSSVDVQELFYYDNQELAEDEEEDALRVVENDTVNLEPVLRDAVVTTLPFQPVCREDCQGLCAECGVRLEDNPGHQHEVLDPRWASLAGLTGTAADPQAAKPEAKTVLDEREES
ncbi:uncharacterized protein BJ994_001648 [Arthrobacter pigmenti]|uniref:DUF177 domain-containing protein n=1 Tax=Arthrobacter pigmenti TaxID=271432 RepID=A0A846RPQ6_9MICC|nr:uncharacterized protein [Arthrobacter pigmenti]